MKCGECKHWGEYDPIEESCDDGTWDSVRNFDLRTCGAVPHVASCIDEPNNTAEGKRALVMDGSGFYAVLRTAEDFGCVLFEEKGDA